MNLPAQGRGIVQALNHLLPLFVGAAVKKQQSVER
jgi:hypothetical protein